MSERLKKAVKGGVFALLAVFFMLGHFGYAPVARLLLSFMTVQSYNSKISSDSGAIGGACFIISLLNLSTSFSGNVQGSPNTSAGIMTCLKRTHYRRCSITHVERQNLNIRMGCRRFIGLTNAFSRKALNHTMAISIYFMFYNFVRSHQTSPKESGKADNRYPTAPAMAAGLTGHAWKFEGMLETVRGS